MASVPVLRKVVASGLPCVRIAQACGEEVYQGLDARRAEGAWRGQEVESDLRGRPVLQDDDELAGRDMPVDDEVGQARDAEAGANAATTSTTNMTGFLAIKRGSSLRKAPGRPVPSEAARELSDPERAGRVLRVDMGYWSPSASGPSASTGK